MDQKYLLPILDDNLKIIGTVELEDNLTLTDAPDYRNQNGLVGLKRLDASYGKYEGLIVFMCYDKQNPKSSYAEIITEREAFNFCLNRGKLDLAHELELNFIDGVEVI